MVALSIVFAQHSKSKHPSSPFDSCLILPFPQSLLNSSVVQLAPPTCPIVNRIPIMADDKFTLIPHSGSSLSQIGPRGGQILAEMVNGALALSRGTGSDTRLTRRFRIGDHELCEPDYQQILLWAKALQLEPATVVQRLLQKSKRENEQTNKTQIINGRMIRLGWDTELLPLNTFEWVDDLAIEAIIFFDETDEKILQYIFGEQDNQCVTLNLSGVPHLTELRCSCRRITSLDLSKQSLLTTLDCSGTQLKSLDLSTVPLLTTLNCSANELTSLNLSHVPLLTTLKCSGNQLTSLRLADVPLLTTLDCRANKFTSLDLTGVPKLEVLRCDNNHLERLDLSSVQMLAELECGDNYLTNLDISAVPLLTSLSCANQDFFWLDPMRKRQNRIAELDVRVLRLLVKLSYCKDKTLLIQRPDQNF